MNFLVQQINTHECYVTGIVCNLLHCQVQQGHDQMTADDNTIESYDVWYAESSSQTLQFHLCFTIPKFIHQ